MSTTILDVASLGKRYVEYSSEFKRFATWFGARVQPTREHWAVSDVSFSLRKGEGIALIGQNGAGKSTLLKLITGTIRPTTGHIAVGGRVSAVLELGLGFNPDLTGRENVIQAGGLMGIPGADLVSLMPEIENFAEIGDFMERPFRTYSSGMGARLMFALATALRPDLLIVDEVLAVGDAYFQHKSFNRIREFRQAGTAILLVTHAMADVRELCDRVLLLDKGKVLKDGSPDEVVDYYNALTAERENAKLSIEQRRLKNGWTQSRSGTFEAVVSQIELLDEAGAEVATARVGQPLMIRIGVRANASIEQLVLGFMIRDRTGHVVYGTNTWHTHQIIRDVEAGQTLTYTISFCCDLGPGSYSISPALVRTSTHLENNYEWTDNMLVFEVVNTNKAYFIGTSSLDVRFEIERMKQ